MSIIVKYIPNILSKEGRKSFKYIYDDRLPVREYIKKDFDDIDLDTHKIIVSGLILNEHGIEAILKDHDEIIITPKVETFVAIGKIVGGIWAFFQIQAVQVMLTLALVAYSIHEARKKPAIPGLSDVGSDDSPTYAWDGIQTAQDVGIPVPIVYGEHRVGGNIIQAYITNDGDKNLLNILLAVSEGEIESITGIEINDNPIANFDGITTYTSSLGTNTQAVLANFNDIHDVQAVNIKLEQNNTYTYTTISNDINGFKLHLQMPNGLYIQDESTGDIQSADLIYSVTYRVLHSGSWSEPDSVTINSKSRTTVRRYYEVTGLAANRYEISITKTSVDTSQYEQTDFYIQSVDETKEDDLAYPNTALLGIKAMASDQLSGGMPKFTCLVKGRKVNVPRVMNGAAEVDWEDYYWNTDNTEYRLLVGDTSLTWDGTTYIDQYSGNPVWCLKDLLVSTRYGLGYYIDADNDIDQTLLVEMSKHCEEKVPDGIGGYEKRFVMNVVLDVNSSAMDWILKLSAMFRCMPFYSEGKIKIRIDKPEDPVQLFTMGNIVKDSFTQSWKSIKSVPNIVEVDFLDKDKNYQRDTVAYTDEVAIAAGDPLRKMKIDLFGSKISQVLREARYALKTAKFINRVVSFKAGFDALAIQPGDVFSISHDVPQWGFSGRVKSGYVGEVTLDQDITITAGVQYSLRIRFADDTIEESIVSNDAGTTNVITLNSVYTQAPQQYDVYAIGPTSSVKKDFRCTSIDKVSHTEAEITGSEYSSSVYDDSELLIPISNFSSLDLSIPTISDLVLTERLIKMGDGSIELGIDVWFDTPQRDNYVQTARNYNVYISDNSGLSWSLKASVPSGFATVIANLQDLTRYDIAVTTVTNFGDETAIANSPQSNITPVGKSAPPSNVSTFILNQSRDTLIFGWTEITDVDKSSYEIRVGASWDAGKVVVSGIKADKYSTKDFQVGSAQSYWIKAVDTTGNYSTTATEAIITVTNIPFQNIINEYSEQTGWAGTKSNTEKSGDNLVLSAGQLIGTYITPNRDQGYIATFRVQIDVITSISTGAAFDSDGTTKFNTDETTRFSGGEAPGAATFEISTSNDNITWSSYSEYQVGDYTCRYFRIRMTLTRDTVDTTLICSQFDYYSDLPDISDRGSGTISPGNESTGHTVTYIKDFHTVPVLKVEIVQGNASYYKVTYAGTDTCIIHLYDIAGTPRTGTLRWEARGT